MFIGTGDTDLLCSCGQSVLIRGYLPANFLAIAIKCFRCGAVSVTPGLPDDTVLPRDAVAVARRGEPMVASATIPRGAVFASQEAIDRDYTLSRPHSPPVAPMPLTSAVLDTTATAYDRLIGGALADHVTVAQRALTLDAAEDAFAWSLARLRGLVDKPGWSWIFHNDDAMAAMHIAAFQHFLHCWGHHPRLQRLAASLAEPGRFLRIMSNFALAKLLYDAGNRVGFSLPDAEPHFSTAAGEALSLAMLAPDSLQWRRRDRWSGPVVRAAVADALASVQGQVNTRRPGILVLVTSILLPNFDQAVVDGIGSVLRHAGRKHRGVAAVAAITPKVVQVKRLDEVGFGYGFYPIINPHFDGENPIRLGSEQDFAASRGAAAR